MPELLITLTPPVLILAGLVVIGVIVSRKLPTLVNLDVDALPAVKTQELKNDLLAVRLQRKFVVVGERVASVLTPVWLALQRAFRRLVHRAKVLESQYREQVRAANPPTATIEVGERTRSLIAEAAALVEAGQLVEAEKKFIESISLDRSNVEVWRKLAELYSSQRQFTEAVDALQYALKLSEKQVDGATVATIETRLAPEMAADHLDLGIIYQQQGDRRQALAHFREALSFEPANPKYLDHVLETAILLGDTVTAWSTFDTLKTTNPENQKLVDFESRIRALDRSRSLRRKKQ